ncbi:BppU family phage baseplate upper protein [Clostridium perfringens]|nr:BppU family phage baseplate upper protein [Clostridium perfringens]
MQYIQTKTVYIDRDELIEIKAIEHDVKSRFIDFRFLSVNNVIDLTYSTVRVFALNSKGSEIYDELTIIDGKKGLARLELTDDLLVPGTTEYQLEARDPNGAILSSNIFKLIVSKRLRDNDDIIQSSNKFTALDKALQKVDNINEIDVRSKENSNKIKEHDSFMRESRTEINKNKEIFDEFAEKSKSFDETIRKTSFFNYISNPIFNTGDLKGWEIWGNGTSWAVKEDTSLSHAYSLKLQCFKNEQGVTQTIPGLVYGKMYTFKASVKVEDGLPGIMIRNDNTWNGVTFKPEQGYNKWIELSFTFMAKEGTTPIYIGNVNNNTTSTFWLSEVMLYEGELDIPFIDNVKELYNKHFQCDLNGFKGIFKDGSYCQLDMDNFALWKDGTAYPYLYLKTQGVVNHLDFNSSNSEHRVYLPSEFRGKHFTVQVVIQGWNFPSGSVNGTLTWAAKDIDFDNGQFTIYFNNGSSARSNCNLSYLVIA